VAKPLHLIGLDLGQAQDPTALAVLRQQGEFFQVPYLTRFPLGTAYPAVVERVAALVAPKRDRSGCESNPLASATLVVDQTGVGRAVVDLLETALPPTVGLVGVTITAGHAAHCDRDGWKVPKKEIVGVLQVLLQRRLLKVAGTLADAKVLAEELARFQVKITAAANEVFGAWREGQHDDLVLAVGIAAWYGQQLPTGPPGRPTVFEPGASASKPQWFP
jgi:hypothetical protein